MSARYLREFLYLLARGEVCLTGKHGAYADPMTGQEIEAFLAAQESGYLTWPGVPRRESVLYEVFTWWCEMEQRPDCVIMPRAEAGPYHVHCDLSTADCELSEAAQEDLRVSLSRIAPADDVFVYDDSAGCTVAREMNAHVAAWLLLEAAAKAQT